MLFATYTFGVFLALVVGLYACLPLRGRQLMLLAASYVFYCWETPVYGLLVLASTVLDYVVGVGLERTQNPRGRRAFLLASIFGNLGLLGFFKYGDFIGENLYGLGRLLGFSGHWEPMGFLLPVGISFYTFQTMSYAIDVYRRHVPAERNFFLFALYVCYFPQLVAGPIERAGHLLPQLRETHPLRLENFVAGGKRILTGLFLKVAVADRLGIFVDSIFASPGRYPAWVTWLSLFAFAIQIYLDFASYASIAIGTARIFGIQLTENFRRPLVSVSIADYWSRWHMTLTRWFTDYVFQPLGGFRHGGARAALNAGLVMVLCGLWHGARWNFVIWGAYQALMLAVYYTWSFYRRHHHRKRTRPTQGQFSLKAAAAIGLTLFVNLVGVIFFRSPDLPTIGKVVRACFGLQTEPLMPVSWTLGGYGLILALVLVVELGQEYGGFAAKWSRLPWAVRAAGWGLLAVLTILGAVNQQAPYIYFQF